MAEQDRAGAGTGRWEQVLYAALVLSSIGLIWLVRYFPSQDGPTHLYNTLILRDLRNGVGPWSAFFEEGPLELGNLGLTVVVYPLLGMVSPIVAERIFLTILIGAHAVGVPWFLRSFGRTPWTGSLLGLVALFHLPLMLGFYSYSLGVPVLLIATGVLWRLRDRPAFMRAVAIHVAGVVRVEQGVVGRRRG